jgi:hypothetical protein
VEAEVEADVVLVVVKENQVDQVGVALMNLLLELVQLVKEMMVEQDLALLPIMLVEVEVELPLLVVIMPLLQQVEQVEQEQIYVLLFQHL